MARIRSIKPEFWTSLTVNRLSPVAALTFVGLWNYCDDWGRAVDDARLIKAAIHPLRDEITPSLIDAMLHEMARLGLIERYHVDGKPLLAIPSWEEHQKPEKRRASRLPAPPTRDAATTSDVDATIPRTFGERSPNTRGSVANISTMEQGAGSREKEQGTGSSEQSREGFAPPLNRDALLTAATNRGITQRYGEQPLPIRATHPSVSDTLAAFEAAGVPDDFAARVLFEKASTCTLAEPPRSLGYFRKAVIEAWQAEQAHREAATFQPPASGGGTPVLDLADRAYRASCVRYARSGNAEYQAECVKLGIDWEAA